MLIVKLYERETKIIQDESAMHNLQTMVLSLINMHTFKHRLIAVPFNQSRCREQSRLMLFMKAGAPVNFPGISRRR